MLSETLDMKVMEYLVSINSPLAFTDLLPDGEVAGAVFAPPKHQAFPTWIHRCSIVFHKPPQSALMVMQAEQSVLSMTESPWMDYEVRCLNENHNSKCPLIPPLWGANWHTINSKRGWLAWRGDPKMVMMCGAGIMGNPDDQKNRATEAYLGPARQVYWAFRIMEHCVKMWKDGARTVDGVKFNDGSTGTAECDSVEAFYLLSYTPIESVLQDRPAIWRKLKLPEA